MDGFDYLAVGRLARQQDCVQVFQREYDAVRTLRELCLTHELDFRFCRFGQSSRVGPSNYVEPSSRLDNQPDLLQDSAREKDSTAYNNKVEKALAALQESQPSFYLLDR